MNDTYEASDAPKFKAAIRQILFELQLRVTNNDPYDPPDLEATVEKIAEATKRMIHTKETGNLQNLMLRVLQMREAQNNYWKAAPGNKAKQLAMAVQKEKIIDQAMVKLAELGYDGDAARHKPEQAKLL